MKITILIKKKKNLTVIEPWWGLGRVLNIFICILSLIFLAAFWSKNHYYPHVTKGQVTSPSHTASAVGFAANLRFRILGSHIYAPRLLLLPRMKESICYQGINLVKEYQIILELNAKREISQSFLFLFNITVLLPIHVVYAEPFACVYANISHLYWWQWKSEIYFRNLTNYVNIIYLFIWQGTRAHPTGQLIGNTAFTWVKT